MDHGWRIRTTQWFSRIMAICISSTRQSKSFIFSLRGKTGKLQIYLNWQLRWWRWMHKSTILPNHTANQYHQMILITPGSIQTHLSISGTEDRVVRNTWIVAFISIVDAHVIKLPTWFIRKSLGSLAICNTNLNRNDLGLSIVTGNL